MKKAAIREMTEGRVDDWVATCGVCDEPFAIRKEDSANNPHPNGSFCPDCQARGLIAPGVLHWKQRLGTYAKPFNRPPKNLY